MDSIKSELDEFNGIELLNLPTDQIKERLQKSQFRLTRLGNVNLRALEVFDQVGEQVKLIQEKVEIISKDRSVSPFAKTVNPVLSDTLMRTRTFFLSLRLIHPTAYKF